MKQILILTAALVAAAGTGLSCKHSGDYTVLVDREDSLLVIEGGYTGEQDHLEAGDALKAEFEVLNGGGPIDFLVLSDSSMTLWEAGQQYEAVIEFANSTGGTKTGTVAASGDYWIVVSNKDDANAERKVFYEVWRKKR